MKQWLVIVLLVAIGVVVFVTGWPVWAGFRNSEYAPYYREDQFLDLRLGDDENYVTGVLGEPLQRDWMDGKLYYRYSLPLGEGYFYKRDVVFEEGQLVGKKSELIKNN